MKTIINYFSRTPNESGSGGALFSGPFDEDWVPHHWIFERLCEAYLQSEEDKSYFLRLTLRAGTLSFYHDITHSSALSYFGLVQSFNGRFDSPIRREENSKIVAALPLSGTR